MHARDQHLLVIGSVEDPDPPPFRQITCGAPEKIVFQLGGAGVFEAEHLTALRVHPGHHMPYGTVFSGGVHRLKNQQQGMAVGCVMQMLQRTQLLDMLLEQRFVLLLRLVNGIDVGRPLPKIDVVAFPDTKVFRMNFHQIPFRRRWPHGAGRFSLAGARFGSLDHSAVFGAAAGGVFASGLGFGVISGACAAAISASVRIIPWAISRPASSGSLRRPATRTSPNGVLSSAAISLLATGAASASASG